MGRLSNQEVFLGRINTINISQLKMYWSWPQNWNGNTESTLSDWPLSDVTQTDLPRWSSSRLWWSRSGLWGWRCWLWRGWRLGWGRRLGRLYTCLHVEAWQISTAMIYMHCIIIHTFNHMVRIHIIRKSHHNFLGCQLLSKQHKHCLWFHIQYRPVICTQTGCFIQTRTWISYQINSHKFYWPPKRWKFS